MTTYASDAPEPAEPEPAKPIEGDTPLPLEEDEGQRIPESLKRTTERR